MKTHFPRLFQKDLNLTRVIPGALRRQTYSQSIREHRILALDPNQDITARCEHLSELQKYSPREGKACIKQIMSNRHDNAKYGLLDTLSAQNQSELAFHAAKSIFRMNGYHNSDFDRMLTALLELSPETDQLNQLLRGLLNERQLTTYQKTNIRVLMHEGFGIDQKSFFIKELGSSSLSYQNQELLLTAFTSIITREDQEVNLLYTVLKKWDQEKLRKGLACICEQSSTRLKEQLFSDNSIQKLLTPADKIFCIRLLDRSLLPNTAIRAFKHELDTESPNKDLVRELSKVVQNLGTQSYSVLMELISSSGPLQQCAFNKALSLPGHDSLVSCLVDYSKHTDKKTKLRVSQYASDLGDQEKAVEILSNTDDFKGDLAAAIELEHIWKGGLGFNHLLSDVPRTWKRFGESNINDKDNIVEIVQCLIKDSSEQTAIELLKFDSKQTDSDGSSGILLLALGYNQEANQAFQSACQNNEEYCTEYASILAESCSYTLLHKWHLGQKILKIAQNRSDTVLFKALGCKLVSNDPDRELRFANHLLHRLKKRPNHPESFTLISALIDRNYKKEVLAYLKSFLTYSSKNQFIIADEMTVSFVKDHVENLVLQERESDMFRKTVIRHLQHHSDPAINRLANYYQAICFPEMDINSRTDIMPSGLRIDALKKANIANVQSSLRENLTGIFSKLFDELNFEDTNHPFYIDPKIFDDSNLDEIRSLKNHFLETLSKIEANGDSSRGIFIMTPEECHQAKLSLSAISEKLEELATDKCSSFIQAMTLLVSGFQRCVSAQTEAIEQVYRSHVLKRAERVGSVPSIISDIIADEKYQIFLSLTKSGGEVHQVGKTRKALQPLINLPHSMETYEERGFQKLSTLQVQNLRKEFLEKMTSEHLCKTVLSKIESIPDMDLNKEIQDLLSKPLLNEEDRIALASKKKQQTANRQERPISGTNLLAWLYENDIDSEVMKEEFDITYSEDPNDPKAYHFSVTGKNKLASFILSNCGFVESPMT